MPIKLDTRGLVPTPEKRYSSPDELQYGDTVTIGNVIWRYAERASGGAFPYCFWSGSERRYFNADELIHLASKGMLTSTVPAKVVFSGTNSTVRDALARDLIESQKQGGKPR